MTTTLTELKISKYSQKDSNIWDQFVENSKNGTFLFFRNYMDYHSDRFQDNSLMFYKNNKLIAILPANICEKTLSSHDGLSFGGFISSPKLKSSDMLDIFSELKIYLRENGIEKFKYKTVPHIYHIIPAEEDLYALFRDNAKLIKREVSTTIYLPEKIAFSKGKKCCISKANKAGINVRKNNDFETFMRIEEELLQSKYGVKPVHSSAEISMLAKQFPKNIQLFSAFDDNEMIAGIIIYENKTVAHAQYISSTDAGKEVGAVDLIADYLINDYYKNKKFFDFGISTEQQGMYLNQGLISQKEMFGGRAVVYDTYELQIS